MDAHFFRRHSIYLSILCILLSTIHSSRHTVLYAAQYETTNFSVENAPSARLAKKFCEDAERYRHELALKWLGKIMPDWSTKCPITVKVGENLGAGGATSFIFQDGEVYGWEMNIQGSAQRILDSVLPHEITHMVLASHFRQPVQRWLDEGAATSVEHVSEKDNYRNMLRHFLRDDVRKCLPFRQMVAMKDYPADPMPFYAQGFSVVEYLLALGDELGDDGPRRLVRFAETGLQNGDWDLALREHYDIDNLGQLQRERWIVWVEAGSPHGKTLRNLLSESRSQAVAMLDAVLPEPISLPQPTGNPIALVSARPSPPNGQSIYEKLVRSEKQIPTKPERTSKVIPIPVLVDSRNRGIYR